MRDAAGFTPGLTLSPTTRPHVTTSLQRHWSAALALSVVAILAACGKDSTAPPPPASVAATSTTTISGTVGAVLSAGPTFVVRDANGNAMSGVGVSVVVTSGGGTLANAPTTSNASGTSVGTWTLGQTAGLNQVTVTVSGLSTPLVLSATGTADVPSQLTVASGNSQSAPAAGTAAAPVAFKVADRFNNGVPNISVTFTVTGGGGSIAGSAAVTTNASGIANAPTWTLGKIATAQSLTATAGTFTAQATASVLTSYNVDVRFFGPSVDATIQAAFFNAAGRISGIITGEQPDLVLGPSNPLDIAGCGVTGVAPLTEIIDDVIIYANVATIDGVGNVLGNAGPCFVRNSTGLTLIGVMNFDVADLQNLINSGRLGDVILHEMLHVVGVTGNIWGNKSLVAGQSTSSWAFTGAQAINGCIAHGGTAPTACGGGSVPVEATGGAGTAGSHWREVTTATGIGLNTELMTGFIEPAGTPNPLSRITIGALGDIGYTVNLLPFDNYTVPSTAALAYAKIAEAQGNGGFEIIETVLEPIGRVDNAGRVTRIPRSY